MKKLLLHVILFFISSCASINSLPQSSKDADFNISKEGRTGWSKYEDTMFIKGIDSKTAYLAAKSGLAEAGFTIKKASYEDLFAIGEHGMTAYDWNVVAGVYVKPEKDGCFIKAQVQGSKDVGFWGDMTASSWTQDIFKGIRNYINTESGINNINKKHFN